MNVQEIFDLLITKGYYRPTDYMYNSIQSALADKVISQKDADKANRLIRNYLKSWDEHTVDAILIELEADYKRRRGYRDLQGLEKTSPLQQGT